MKMDASRNVLFDSSADFYSEDGSVWMRLSPHAAVEVCLTAAANGKVIARIEGGIWHSPGFEARHDCIWDGADPPLDELAAHQNNLAAADFIREEMDVHSVFILTAPPISGWPHKRAAPDLDS
jgi:hypothetical protein